MDLILNERTQTAHRPETGVEELHAVCGVTRQLAPDQLRTVSLERTNADATLSKCGRCFDDGGGY